MSGVAGGIILLPYVFSIIAAKMTVAATDAALKRVTDETGMYYQYSKIREEAQLRQSGAERQLIDARSMVQADLQSQARLQKEVSDNVLQQIELQRREIAGRLEKADEEEYKEYLNQLSDAGMELTNRIETMQAEFVNHYHAKIQESMGTVTNAINIQYGTYLEELSQYKDNLNAKKELAAGMAGDYIKEAEALLLSLVEDYEGERYAGFALKELREALDAAREQYQSGNYEAALATAKDVSVNVIEEIYKADCKGREWGSYYQYACLLADELEVYIISQDTITQEIKEEAEKAAGRSFEDEIVGIRISEYTELMKSGNGMHRYDYLLEKTRELKRLLQSEEIKSADTDQLKEYIHLLNDELYPAVTKTIYKGILNMNNAFSRQNISEEIIDFFEEHNFNFDGYSYDEDRHDGALHIGLSNDTTGEEIVVTLAPELVGGGDIRTKVEIHQLKGDETNEERKEYYRTGVQQVVFENTPGAQIHLECDKSTKNRLSEKTELRDKIKG